MIKANYKVKAIFIKYIYYNFKLKYPKNLLRLIVVILFSKLSSVIINKIRKNVRLA